MLQNLMFIICFILTIIFIQLNHPLAMGLILLMQTFMVCMIINFMNETFWFSYILFLIFLGGMLVLFIYVTSLASNNKFNLSMNMIYMIYIFMCMYIMFMNFYDLSIMNLFYEKNINIKKENFFNLIKLFNYPTFYITILLMNYLLISLIAIVKITNIFYGPLRQMFN